MTETVRLDFTLLPPHGLPTRADARLVANGRAKPVVLFVHGFKGFKEWGPFNLLADFFARSGMVFVKPDLSHNGSSDESAEPVDLEAFGQNNFSLELADIRALTDLICSPESPLPAAETDPERIFIIGHSRGGGLAILAGAEDQRLRAVAAWAAISNIDQRWTPETVAKWREDGVQYVDNARTGQKMPLYYQLYEDYLAHRDRLNIPAAAARLRQPLLLVHGDQDETLPVQMAFDLQASQPRAELMIISGGNHTFGGRHPYRENQLPPDLQAVARKTFHFFQSS